VEDTAWVEELGTCDKCGRPNRRLYHLRPSQMANEDEELMLCIRCRAIRRFLIFWMWVFRLGEGVG
jgi:hypothetical protein